MNVTDSVCSFAYLNWAIFAIGEMRKMWGVESVKLQNNRDIGPFILVKSVMAFSHFPLKNQLVS